VSRLILVRHSEPQEDARGRCYGSLDIGLSASGRRRARELAARLGRLDCDAVYTSPRLRARETAEPIAAARGIELSTDERLRELEFGELEGRTYDEIAESEPELYRAWMATPTRVRFPGGESFADLKARALAALDQIREAHDAAVVVTHGGVLRAGVATWLSMPDEAIFRLDQRYGGVTIVDWLDGSPLVRLLNGDVP
jgi:alpha-ribazole phosphatase/probable phosphoglycerate mutase